MLFFSSCELQCLVGLHIEEVLLNQQRLFGYLSALSYSLNIVSSSFVMLTFQADENGALNEI